MKNASDLIGNRTRDLLVAQYLNQLCHSVYPADLLEVLVRVFAMELFSLRRHPRNTCLPHQIDSALRDPNSSRTSEGSVPNSV
jgi:hypothetical protein